MAAKGPGQPRWQPKADLATKKSRCRPANAMIFFGALGTLKKHGHRETGLHENAERSYGNEDDQRSLRCKHLLG